MKILSHAGEKENKKASGLFSNDMAVKVQRLDTK